MKVYQPLQPLRGGSWYFQPRFARASNRFWGEPSNRNGSLGFRCTLIVWRRR